MQIGLSLAISRALGSAGPWEPLLFADSVNGSDSNDGLSAENAVQTLSALETAISTYGAGARVGLARGSYWREQLDVGVNGLSIGVYGTGDIPVIDGADIITGTWTQPDAGTYPNVWSISWTRSQAATTGQAYMGYWQEGARTTRQTSLAALQAGANGDWHTTSLTGTTVTLSIKSAADPNSDGLLREATKRGYCINGHPVTVLSTYTGQSFIGPLELRRAVEHYNALSMGPGSSSRMLLRDGNIHHSVSEGNQADSIVVEYSPDEASSQWAFYRSVGSGFTPVATRLIGISPGGDDRINAVSAFYCHASTGNPDSFTVNGCASVGASFANAAASLLTVNGGYCEDAPTKSISFSASNNVISNVLIHETSASPFNDSNAAFFTPTAAATNATVSNCAARVAFGQGAFQPSAVYQHNYTNCSFYTQASAFSGGKPAVNYCVCFALSRTLHNLASGYSGDYNVYIFAGQPNPQFQWNGTVYGTLALFQAATGQDANSVFLKAADQTSGNANAFWLGVATAANSGPPDGDWRINPSAKVYSGAGTAYYGTFPDGTTPITSCGVQTYYNFNTRTVESGVPAKPTLPSSVAEARTYIADPEAWDFYP